MAKDLGLAITAGLLSAILFLSVVTGSPLGMLLTYLALLPVLGAGLALGTVAACVAALAGLVAGGVATQGLTVPVYAVTVAIPGVLVTRQALLWRSGADGSVHWYPPGLLLGWLSAAAMVMVTLGVALLGQHSQGAEAAVRDMGTAALDALGSAITPELHQAALAVWVPVFPALAAGWWLVMVVVNAAVAQALLVKAGHSRRPSPSYAEAALPPWLGVAMVAGWVAGLLADGTLAYGARNVAGVLAVPFGLTGLGVVHRFARTKARPRLLLSAFYGMLVLAFVWVAAGVVVLGMIDYWMNLRRLRAGGRGQEEE